jgi:hypothetical protein
MGSTIFTFQGSAQDLRRVGMEVPSRLGFVVYGSRPDISRRGVI